MRTKMNATMKAAMIVDLAISQSLAQSPPQTNHRQAKAKVKAKAEAKTKAQAQALTLESLLPIQQTQGQGQGANNALIDARQLHAFL